MAATRIRLEDVLSPSDIDFRFGTEEDGPRAWTEKMLREFVEERKMLKQRDGKQVDLQDAKRMRLEARSEREKNSHSFGCAATSRKNPAASEAEEARRNHDPVGEAFAVKKWLATGDPESAFYYVRMCDEESAARELEDDREEEDWSDLEVVNANRFRNYWNFVYAGLFGSFEDTKLIPSMLYTDEPAHCRSGLPRTTLQIFSVKVVGIEESLHWPLDVYGIVAARDCLDHNRNIIFSRERDDCQTITNEDPNLELTGPTHAVVLLDPAYVEVKLKVKGSIESEDKDLSFLSVPYRNCSRSCVMTRAHTSKLCTLELTSRHVFRSVEATISVKILGGSWPDGFQGVFAANTASIDDKEVLLLAFGDGKLPVAPDGMIKLSRRVASVEVEGELNVSAAAGCRNQKMAAERDVIGFKPKEAGRSRGILKVASCEMEVTVAWSLLPFSPIFRDLPCDDGVSSSPSELICEMDVSL
ncbi:unnamed protein product [Alopecurus aequalis]